MISIASIVFIIGLNLVTVKLFGEMEFWFALVKIIAIVVLIAVGLWMIFTGFTSDAGTVASFSHIWDHGGIFPTGAMGFLAGFQIAIFAFVGVELVGTTAAETKDPEKNLPKAVNSIPIRIIIFYVLALLIVMSVTPWNQIDPNVSPFVNLFSQAGIAAAAIIMNLVVLSSVMSSMNSGVFSTSRMLFGLSREKQAPVAFGRLNRRAVLPTPCISQRYVCCWEQHCSILFQILSGHLPWPQLCPRFCLSVSGSLLSGAISCITKHVRNCMPNQPLSCRAVW